MHCNEDVIYEKLVQCSEDELETLVEILHPMELSIPELKDRVVEIFELQLNEKGELPLKTKEQVLYTASLKMVVYSLLEYKLEFPIFFNNTKENIILSTLDAEYFIFSDLQFINGVGQEAYELFVNSSKTFDGLIILTYSSIYELIEHYWSYQDIGLAMSDYYYDVRGNSEKIRDFDINIESLKRFDVSDELLPTFFELIRTQRMDKTSLEIITRGLKR